MGNSTRSSAVPICLRLSRQRICSRLARRHVLRSTCIRRTSRSVARCSTSTCSRTKGSRCKVPEPGGIDADSSDSFDDVVDLWEAMPVDIDDCLSDMSKCDPEAGAEILRAVTHSPSVNLLDKLAAYFCRSGQHRTLPICSTVTDMDHANDDGPSKRPVTATQ